MVISNLCYRKMKIITTLAFLSVSVYGMAASETLYAFDDPPAAAASPESAATETISLKLEDHPVSIWEHGVGEGFRRGLMEVGLEFGGSVGHQAFGSQEAHDFALVKLQLGRMIGGLRGEGHWYRGNWEALGELLAGTQVNPDGAYLAALTPVLRYNFATGTRWVPFVDAGAGVTATDIGGPDLSTTFQFNTQVGFGVRRFITEKCAVTLQYRYMHISNAGIEQPNHGVNMSAIYIGSTWFF